MHEAIDLPENLRICAYLTLFAPLAIAVVITLLTLKQKALSGLLALAGIVLGLGCTIVMATHVFAHESFKPHEIEWLSVGGITLKFGVTVDALSVLMSLVVTGVGACIFLFSQGYMKGEDGFSRYFACLSLFAFSMLGIVFSTNFVQTFIFWELVGVSSYSLIGYYFAKPSAVDAGKKAFLTNRIGDFGMTCGILLLFFTLAQDGTAVSFSFADLAGKFHRHEVNPHGWTMQLAAFLIFTGAMAKSAQVPLHVWLPDAMEGPTPVSALMHAATMVAAGVYMVARTYFLFFDYATALNWIAGLGGATALLAACMAFTQNDIKKVLAYSTLSQLGYMVLALGLYGPGAAMFHLTTHAAFKALLFLCAGSVIYGCHHEQDMRNMGGLRKLMPVTAWTFIIGSLALAGIPPFAGFWSKDAVLGTALHGSPVLFGVALLVAFMTACYMGRAYLMTFEGEYRGGHGHEAHAVAAVAAPHGHAGHGDHGGHGGGGHAAHDAGHGGAHAAADDHGGHHGGTPHESPAVMTIPLCILAVLSVVSGFFSIPKGFMGAENPGKIDHLLVGPGGPSWFPGIPEEHFNGLVAAGGTVAALLGMFVAWQFYGSRKWSIDSFVATIGPIHKWVDNKFYFDDVYLWLVREVQQRIADLCAAFEKNFLVGVVVDGLSALTKWFGLLVRRLLDGHLHRYVTLALFGLVAVLAYLGMRG
jgi:proton-translocating NADH-quinone oxidoreductase chain L